MGTGNSQGKSDRIDVSIFLTLGIIGSVAVGRIKRVVPQPLPREFQ